MLIYSKSVTSTAYKVTKTMTGVECDVCNKIIPVVKGHTNRYFEVTTGHMDWGNDSCESRKTFDICPECVGKYVSDYLKDCSNTGYLEIETKVIWGRLKYELVDRPPVEGEVDKEGHDNYC